MKNRWKISEKMFFLNGNYIFSRKPRILKYSTTILTTPKKQFWNIYKIQIFLKNLKSEKFSNFLLRIHLGIHQDILQNFQEFFVNHRFFDFQRVWDHSGGFRWVESCFG